MAEVTISSGQVLLNTHHAGLCAGDFCALHNPSDHHMVRWGLHATWQPCHSYGLNECFLWRQCPCGNLHPDPDDFNYHFTRHGGAYGCECECQCCSVEWPNTWQV